MKYFKTSTQLEIVIEEALLEKIESLAISHYPKEFGGFLIGRYTNNFKTAEILDIILPIKYTNTQSSFTRLTDNIIDTFKGFYETQKLYYLGEWHSHPNGSTIYSHTDLQSMKDIESNEEVSIRNPILLILSVRYDKVENFTFYYYNKQNLIPYE